MDEKQMQHGCDWEGQNLTGYFLSEKLDGCRAYWDGRNLWSRGGIKVNLPSHLAQDMPSIALDCELYDGINGVYRAGHALKRGIFTPTMRLFVFDAPTIYGDWQLRMDTAKQSLKNSAFAQCVDWRICNSTEDALKTLIDIQKYGGEGLMLRANTLTYRPGRTSNLIKVKSQKPRE